MGKDRCGCSRSARTIPSCASDLTTAVAHNRRQGLANTPASPCNEFAHQPSQPANWIQSNRSLGFHWCPDAPMLQLGSVPCANSKVTESKHPCRYPQTPKCRAPALRSCGVPRQRCEVPTHNDPLRCGTTRPSYPRNDSVR